jgi:hypothetical protein
MRKSTLLLAVLSLIAAAKAQALSWNSLSQYKQPNIHWGQLALHPYYQLSEMYDSNIYLVPRDQANGVVVGGGRRESWITKNDLGLEAVLPWHNVHKLELGYNFEAQTYTTQPSINNAVNQTAHADYTYSGAYGVTLKAGDRYVNTVDQAFSELVGRNRRWSNRGYMSAEYEPKGNRMAFGVDAFQENNKYIRPDLAAVLNRYEQKAGFHVGYRVYPKTKVYVAYHYGLIHYSVPAPLGGFEKDNHSQTASAGVSGQLAPKVEGKIEGGMTYRQYARAAVNGASRITRSPMVDTALTYKPDQLSTITLDMSRYYEESVDPANPFYIANNVSMELARRFPPKLSAGVWLAYSLDRYEYAQAGGTRRDDIYRSRVWTTYEIQKWLSTGLSYLYRQRNSTFSGQFNYEDHQAGWDVALKF